MIETENPANCDASTDCEHCNIRHTVLFADLTPEDLSTVHLPISDMGLAKGDALYQQGQAATAMFTIREGLVKLEQYLEDGTYRIVSLLGPGDLAGLEASITNDYEHTAVALLPTKVCRIPRDVVKQLSHQVTGQLMSKWHSMVRRSHQCALELSTGSARQRMARLLLLLTASTGADCHLFAREDVGALLGITTETACRMVSDLKRKNVISEITSNTFRCDIDALQDIAKG